MTQRRRNPKSTVPSFLGKGASGDAPPPETAPPPTIEGVELRWIDPADIEWPEGRISSEYDPMGLQALGDSLTSGQEDPIIVRQMADGRLIGAGGMNRCLAAAAKGLQVQAVVRAGDERDVVHANLRTAVQQSRPNPLSEVQGVASAIFETGLSIDDVIADTGKSREWVETRVEISECSPWVLEGLGDGTILLGHAAQLARVQSHDRQDELLGKIRQYGWTITELTAEMNGENQTNVQFNANTRTRKAKVCGCCKEQGPQVQAVVCEKCLAGIRKMATAELVPVPAQVLKEAEQLLAGSQEGAQLAEQIAGLLEAVDAVA